jgi:hypothetical protein
MWWLRLQETLQYIVKMVKKEKIIEEKRKILKEWNKLNRQFLCLKSLTNDSCHTWNILSWRLLWWCILLYCGHQCWETTLFKGFYFFQGLVFLTKEHWQTSVRVIFSVAVDSSLLCGK